ncbi:hypothetical protein GQ55_4G054100 [Panicum hallii var. hallii]|uniref:Uncharacterized protein n=1 Tax=Panicum hallii var. hallii TaxID=1504633 RepID=A0A2T7DVI2_9POAL|nr:hypothetical protein GQ55_4G054100 [Panicum hallii var. hallii]
MSRGCGHLDRFACSGEEAIRAGVTGGRRVVGRRLLDALQEHPVLGRRREPVGGGEQVAAVQEAAAAAAVAERPAGVLLLPADQLVLERRRRGRVAPVEVVEGHDARGRREAVVAREADDRGPERAGGGRGDARELLHHGAEVGRVRVQQRHGRAPRRAGPPPRRLPDTGPVGAQLLLGRLGRAPAGPARGRRARRGGREHVGPARRDGIGGSGQPRGGVVVVELGPLREARAGVTHRHGRRKPVEARGEQRATTRVVSEEEFGTAAGTTIYSGPARGQPDVAVRRITALVKSTPGIRRRVPSEKRR